MFHVEQKNMVDDICPCGKSMFVCCRGDSAWSPKYIKNNTKIKIYL